jgi:hypothetical protein
MDNWQLDNLPIGKFEIVTEPNLVTGEIRVVTKMMGQVKEQIIQTTNDQVRNALIDMGWIPPDTPGEIVNINGELYEIICLRKMPPEE